MTTVTSCPRAASARGREPATSASPPVLANPTTSDAAITIRSPVTPTSLLDPLRHRQRTENPLDVLREFRPLAPRQPGGDRHAPLGLRQDRVLHPHPLPVHLGVDCEPLQP